MKFAVTGFFERTFSTSSADPAGSPWHYSVV
jgi:hypothetical protein